MTGQALPPGVWGFDDLAVGDWVETDRRGVTVGMIDGFADLTGDRFEIHMSDEAALRHGFPARVAHGLLVLSVIDGLKNQTPAQFKAVASLEWTWGFKAPVLAGDEVWARLVVEEKRETRRGDRGILRLGVEASNQDGVVVQRGQNLLMVYR